MRTHFVDRLLARLDGEVASIWVTIAVRVELPPDEPALRATIVALHRATPRLHAVWSEPRGGWRASERSDAELAASLEVDRRPRPHDAIVARIIARPVDLTRDLGFVVGMYALAEGGTLLTFQLHHALGDARSLGLVLRRMFGNEAPATAPEPRPRMGEASVVRAAMARPRPSARLLRARARMLATRAVALPRDGDHVGAPQVASATLELAGGPRVHAGWFYAAIARVAARWTTAERGWVRLRVPIDLSREFAFPPPPANTCITVPLELDVARLRAATTGHHTLDYVRGELADLLERGAIWPALLETLVVSHVASRGRLRAGARPGLVAPRRTNTMVATYVGAIDDYFAAAPFSITRAVGHTPTWGASAFTLHGRLVVNVSGFDGLWSRPTLERFRDDVGDWLVAQGARYVERGP